MRRTVGRISFRLYPEQARIIERFIEDPKHPERWRGPAWWAREVFVRFCAAEVNEVSRARRSKRVA